MWGKICARLWRCFILLVDIPVSGTAEEKRSKKKAARSKDKDKDKEDESRLQVCVVPSHGHMSLNGSLQVYSNEQYLLFSVAFAAHRFTYGFISFYVDIISDTSPAIDFSSTRFSFLLLWFVWFQNMSHNVRSFPSKLYILYVSSEAVYLNQSLDASLTIEMSSVAVCLWACLAI